MNFAYKGLIVEIIIKIKMKNLFGVMMMLLANVALAEKCKLGLSLAVYESDVCTGDPKAATTRNQEALDKFDACTKDDESEEYRQQLCFEDGMHSVTYSDAECKTETFRLVYEWDTCIAQTKVSKGEGVTYTEKYVKPEAETTTFAT